MTNTQIKNNIQAHTVDKTLARSISNVELGEDMKAIVDYVDQEKRPYKIYTATINQSSTNIPVASIFENTIGTIDWTYLGVGNYIGTLIGPNIFTNNKTLCIPDRRVVRTSGDGQAYTAYLERFDNTRVRLYSTSNNIPTDDLIIDLTVEIRVYN